MLKVIPKHCVIVLSIATILCTTPSFAIDGFSASIAWRRAGLFSGQSTPEHWVGHDTESWRGKLVRFTIQGNGVTGHDTLDNYLAQCAAINFEGTHIAYYRLGCYLEGNTLMNPDGYGHIAVIPKDGGSPKLLVALPAFTESSVMDWPLGDYIYYNRPSQDNVYGSGEIWRVNWNDGSDHAKILDYSPVDEYVNANGITKYAYVRRWTVSLDGTVAATQVRDGTLSNPDGIYTLRGQPLNSAHCWPVYSASDLLACTSEFAVDGCNVAIAPSGRILGHYISGSHSSLIYRVWDPDNMKHNQSYTELTNCSDSRHDRMDRDADIERWYGRSVGSGSEFIKWSVNSDRWVIQHVGRAGHAAQMRLGTNQVIANPFTKEVIVTSNNPGGTENTVNYGNTTGDFYVAGHAGRMETIDGEWVEVAYPTESPGRVHALRLKSRTLHVAENGIVVRAKPGRLEYVSLTTLQGKVVYRAVLGDASMTIPTAHLSSATYLVTVSSGPSMRSFAVPVNR